MQSNFYNQVIDKKGLKRILSWFIENYGPTRTSQLIEYFKLIGFHYATRAGLSLGFEDLKIPPTKRDLLLAAQKEVRRCENNYLRGNITALERYQKLIDIWTTTSENLKEEVIKNFQKTPLNPLYMMAFSGARGNISQVRQLVGMRGLMSDSGGGIIDFPIRSNFREGLSVTEYVISCYGARKGLIDTALRTADSGYLTRRLVDVAHSIMVFEIDCGTPNSISVSLSEKNLLGRVLASTIRVPEGKFVLGSHTNFSGLPTPIIAWKNQDISSTVAREIITASKGINGQPGFKSVPVRSPLTCQSRGICQLCYGWNLAQGRFVSIGDAVGILAAQSIGEPGTQLTMRTFHTGGIFSTDILDKIFAPHEGIVSYEKLPKGCKVRSVHGETGFFTFEPVKLRIEGKLEGGLVDTSVLQLPAQSLIFAYPGKYVEKNDLCAEISRLGGPMSPGNSSNAGSSVGETKKGEPNSALENSTEGSYKIVLSEIQGQVSFGFRGSQETPILAKNVNSETVSSHPNLPTMSPNEVWVLAGDIFDHHGPVGMLGDLMYWRGSRGRAGGGKAPGGLTPRLGQNFVPSQKNNFKRSYEVRGNIIVRMSEQKRVKMNEGFLGGLLRSKDSRFKNEYTSQIIRKIGRGSGGGFHPPPGLGVKPPSPPRTKNQKIASGLPRFLNRDKLSNPSQLSLVIRRVQPHLLSGANFENESRGSEALIGFEKPTKVTALNLRSYGSIVHERDPLCRLLLPNQQSKTGDIVQGLPKIEQLFEGRGGFSGSEEQRSSSTLPLSELRALIQQRLVDEIQSVYQSQGVEIADKHIEIIVRLMTSKVRILEKGTSPFFPDDIVDLHFVQQANLPETHYEPIVLGITKVAFLTESFVSAASFQETKRVLMSSALQNRVDFLNGLKENVIVGRLIPAGTGSL